jgi:hypothetical protein
MEQNGTAKVSIFLILQNILGKINFIRKLNTVNHSILMAECGNLDIVDY